MTIKWVGVLGTGVCGLRRNLNSASKILAVLMCALLLCVSVARSQQNTADILGTVTDTSGAVVPGASCDAHQHWHERHPDAAVERIRRLHIHSGSGGKLLD